MKRVFISGPYSRGDMARNVARAMAVANAVMDLGAAPYCPHLAHFLHMAHPRDYEEWMALDLEYVGVCDALFRMEGESAGADREVLRAIELGIPVFYTLADLEAWLLS
jgi:hypothetical protein